MVEITVIHSGRENTMTEGPVVKDYRIFSITRTECGNRERQEI